MLRGALTRMNAISTTRRLGFSGFSGTFRRPQVIGRSALLESNGQGTTHEATPRPVEAAGAGVTPCDQAAADPRTSAPTANTDLCIDERATICVSSAQERGALAGS